jgi:CBS domain-containing protein
MSDEVKYCFDDQTTDEITRNMADIQVRRLPVVDRNKRLVGILSLGDLAHADTPDAGKALKGISQRGGEHSQSVSRH